MDISVSVTLMITMIMIYLYAAFQQETLQSGLYKGNKISFLSESSSHSTKTRATATLGGVLR